MRQNYSREGCLVDVNLTKSFSRIFTLSFSKRGIALSRVFSRKYKCANVCTRIELWIGALFPTPELKIILRAFPNGRIRF